MSLTYLSLEAIKRRADAANWEDTILVVANSKADALEASDKWNAQKIDGDNCYWPDSSGILIKAIRWEE